jgi:hypothetical protein
MTCSPGDPGSGQLPSPACGHEGLLRRLIAPLLRAGWTESARDWEEGDDEDESRGWLELYRSSFNVLVSWDWPTRTLSLSDPEQEGDDDALLPVLCPLDEALTIELPDAPQVMQAETARRAFAAAGLLDATRMQLPGHAADLRGDVVVLLMDDTVYRAARAHRGTGHVGGPTMAFLDRDFNWRISCGMRAYPLIVPDAVPAVAARGVAEWCWRRESDVEDWHFKVGDLTMARANIAATRAVLPHVHSEGVDWPAVRLALTAPTRRLASGLALSELFEEGWSPILASIHREIDRWCTVEDQLGPEAVLRLLTLHGSRTESVGEWWGSGWYETAVRSAVARTASDGALPAGALRGFRDADHFADAVVHGPDLLDDDLLDWVTEAFLEERSRRREARQCVPPAFTMPDWAAGDLALVLKDDQAEDPGHRS